MSCNIVEVIERLENEQPFRRFTYVTAHSPTLPLLHLHHQLILQPFFLFSYATGSSLTSPGEPPMNSDEPFFLRWCILYYIHRHGMVGRVPAFQPGSLGSIPGWVRNFNFCPGIVCVSFVYVLSCVVSGSGPDIVLTTHSGRPALVYLCSVLVQRLLLPLQTPDPRAFGL